MFMGKRLTQQQREKKLREWRKMYRKLHPIKISWNQIPDLDAETIAVSRDQTQKLLRFLNQHKITFWSLGPLETVCSRPDHNL
jgi:hypothetical protein